MTLYFFRFPNELLSISRGTSASLSFILLQYLSQKTEHESYTTATSAVTSHAVYKCKIRNIEHHGAGNVAALIRELAATPLLLNSQLHTALPQLPPLLIKHPAHYKYTHQIKSNQRCGNLQRVSSLRTRSNARISGRTVSFNNKKLHVCQGNALPVTVRVVSCTVQLNTNVQT